MAYTFCSGKGWLLWGSTLCYLLWLLRLPPSAKRGKGELSGHPGPEEQAAPGLSPMRSLVFTPSKVRSLLDFRERLG